jgi:hypothetical protein
MPTAEPDNRTRLTAPDPVEPPPPPAAEAPEPSQEQVPESAEAAPSQERQAPAPEATDNEPQAEKAPEKAPEPKAKSEVEKLVEKFASDAKRDDVEDPTPQDGESEEPASSSTQPVAAAPAQPAAPVDEVADLEGRVQQLRIPPKDRKIIARLIERTKQAEAKAKEISGKEPLAGLGQDIITTCEQAKWAPQDYRAWVAIGARAHQGDPEALKILANHLRQAGVIPPEPTWTVADERELSELIANGDVSGGAAQIIREKASKLGSVPATPPRPQPQQAPPQQLQPAPAIPAGFEPQAVERGKAALAECFAKLAQEIPDQTTREKVEAEIQTKIEGFRGTPPAVWGQVFDAVKEGITAKLRAQSVKPIGKTGLRPSTQSTSGTPAFKTERERVLHKYGS